MHKRLSIPQCINLSLQIIQVRWVLSGSSRIRSLWLRPVSDQSQSQASLLGAAGQDLSLPGCLLTNWSIDTIQLERQCRGMFSYVSRMSGLISRVNLGTPTPARNWPTSSEKVLVLRVRRSQDPGLSIITAHWSDQDGLALLLPELVFSKTEDVIQEDGIRELGLSEFLFPDRFSQNRASLE